MRWMERLGPWPVRAAAALAVLAVVGTIASLWLYAVNLSAVHIPISYVWGDAVAGVVYPIAGAVLVRRRPGNVVGWVFTATSVLAIDALANQWAVTALLVQPGLPFGALAAWIGGWGWTTALLVPALLPLLFPDGAPSPRIRRFAGVVVATLAVVVLAAMLGKHPIDATERIVNPLGQWAPPWVNSVMVAGIVLVVAVITPVSVVLLALRLRRSSGVERAQLSWLSLGAVVAATAALANVVVPRGWEEVAWALGALAIPAGVLVAVVRHRLLDIEVVLNRTIVYVLLSGIVLAGYALAVLSIGAAAGTRIGVVAVAALALLVAVVRNRVQTGVDRLLFGARRDPYAVVTRVGRRLDVATGPEDALARLVDELREALRLPSVAVVPVDTSVPVVESGTAVAGVLEVPVVVQGERVAVLAVGARHRGERFTPDERSAIEDVARRAGALVQAAGLLAELRASRERVIAAREEERRRIRSDLHDGVGPKLAGMALQLDSLTARLEHDPALAERARRLRDGVRETVAEVRRVVDDLRPPALDELGLVGALRQHVAAYAFEPAGAQGSVGPEVEVGLDAPLPDLPAAVEVAAFRIATEAVANAVRHSGCRTCSIHLGLADAGLTVEVVDDGSGLPPGVAPHVGLVSMRERATEIGGRLTIDSGKTGTRVRAWLPLPAGAA